LTVEQTARVLTASGWKPVTVEMVQADIDEGAPVNADGTINIVNYACWLLRGMGHAG
jgi:hypothetical protein